MNFPGTVIRDWDIYGCLGKMEDLEIAARNILRDPVKHSARVPLSSHREKFSAKTVLKTAENLSSVAFSL